MRSSQWKILGTGLWIIGFILMYMGSQAQLFCIKSGYSAGDISCMRWQAFSPFIYTLFLLGVIFYINGWVESSRLKKRLRRAYANFLTKGREIGFVRDTAFKYKLKHLPNDIYELIHWSKLEGKEKEIKKEIDKFNEEDRKEKERAILKTQKYKLSELLIYEDLLLDSKE